MFVSPSHSLSLCSTDTTAAAASTNVGSALVYAGQQYLACACASYICAWGGKGNYLSKLQIKIPTAQKDMNTCGLPPSELAYFTRKQYLTGHS